MFCRFCEKQITKIEILLRKNMVIGENIFKPVYYFKQTGNTHKECYYLNKQYGEIYFLINEFMSNNTDIKNKDDLQRIWHSAKKLKSNIYFKRMAEELQIDFDIVERFMTFLETKGKFVRFIHKPTLPKGFKEES